MASLQEQLQSAKEQNEAVGETETIQGDQVIYIRSEDLCIKYVRLTREVSGSV